LITRRRIAIDIGTHTIKLVIGSQRSKSLVIHHAYTYPTPSESYNDGYIRNIESLHQAIQNLFWENDIRTKRVIFTMQSSSAMIREIILPYTKGAKELQAMLSFEIEQHLPVNLESHVMEYKVLEELIDNGVKKIKILIAVLPKKIVEEYLRLTKFLGLKPIAFNIHSDTIAKFFEKEQYINDHLYSPHQTVSLISFGHEQIHITIIEKGLLKLQWLIPRGGKEIAPYICNPTKKEQHTDPRVSYEDKISDFPLMIEPIQSFINKWIQEIQLVFQYYMSRTEKNRLDAIYIYGGSSNLSGLAQVIEKQLNIPTFQIKKIDMICFSENVQEKDLPIYLPAITALLK